MGRLTAALELPRGRDRICIHAHNRAHAPAERRVEVIGRDRWPATRCGARASSNRCVLRLRRVAIIRVHEADERLAPQLSLE
jgi:hypothetical protein